MDFLRQLAPARETDAARAVAVLPSRFSNPYPLQDSHDHSLPAQGLFDDRTLLASQAGWPSVANPGAVAHRLAAVFMLPGQVSPVPLAGQMMQQENEKSIPPAAGRERAIDALTAPSPHVIRNLAADSAERVRPTLPQGTSPAAAELTATPARQGASAPPAPARQAWPLSDARLAQRMPRPQDEGPVIHVTIGRIEVVAHTAPAQAPPRSPAPRQPSVTLAHYLRGSPEGRP